MTQASKSKSRMLWLKEVIQGIKPSITPGDSIQVPFEGGESLDASQPFIPNPNITGSQNYARGVPDRVECGGDMPLNLDGLAHGLLMTSMFGPDVITGADPYDHTFETGDLSSFTVEKGFTDINQYFEFNGVTNASWEITVDAAGYLKITTSWLGFGEADTSPSGTSMDSAPTVYTGKPFGLARANTVIKEGGSAIGTATALTISGDNELDGDQYTLANKGKRASLKPDKQRVIGTLTAFFENETLYNKAKNETASSIEISVQNGDGLGSAGNEKFVFTLAEIFFSASVPKIGTSGGVDVELPFEAVVESGSATVTAVLTNSIDTAY